jgi:hypothetical protein
MNDDSIDRNALLGPRRRLLRGSFAAPAVLTLYSGSVLASTSMQCLQRNAPRQTPAVSDSNSNRHDTYLRYQLWALVPRDGGRPHSFYIQGRDLAGRVSAGFKPKAGQWQNFDVVGNKAGDTVSSKPELKAHEFKLVNKYAVLRIGVDASVVGVGDGLDGYVCTRSCASSLVGAAFLKL